jgi:hypothetical protein
MHVYELNIYIVKFVNNQQAIKKWLSMIIWCNNKE